MRTINLDITHKCTLQCDGCNRQVKDYIYEKREITLDEFEKVCDYFDKIILCGQVSDPIFHENFALLLKMAFDRDVTIEVHTAASHRKVEQYKLFFEANPNAKWYFGIDGHPRDSSKYRINQDGEYLFNIMRMAKEVYNMDVVWQYIIFDYNEDHVYEAAMMARHLGINFLTIETQRGKQETQEYDFQPKCIQGKKEIGHTTSGYLLPCCWSDFYKNEIPELTQEHLKIDNVNSIEEIIHSKEWNDFKNRLKTNPPEYCKMYCGYKKNSESVEVDFI